MVLEFPIMADYAMITEGDLNIFVTHGHHFNEKKLPPMFEKTQRVAQIKKEAIIRKIIIYYCMGIPTFQYAEYMKVILT